ncbi:MAG: CoA pyrophosphatase [Nocardioidaceae bacterium]
MPDASAPLPDWLAPVPARLGEMRGEDVSAFLPPEDDPETREGAVLVLLSEPSEGPSVLLTERGHRMRSQPGHVSFPGGGMELGETAVEAALREANEETGLDPDSVQIVAEMPRIWLPPRNYAVSPVVGYWRDPVPLQVVDPIEVHAIFNEPISRLVDPASRFTVHHPLGWKGPGWMIGPDKDVLLWGFTAGIIDALLRFLGWSQPWDKEVRRPLPDNLIDWSRINRDDRDHKPSDEPSDEPSIESER